MTWQKWGSKQALEKRKTSLSLIENLYTGKAWRMGGGGGGGGGS